MPCGPTTSWTTQGGLTAGFSTLAAPTSVFTTSVAPATNWGDCCDCADTVPAPTLTSLNPATTTQGATVNVILVGTGFTAASVINVSGAGITIQNIVFVSSVGLTADFVVGVGATISTRTVSVTTAGGTSNTQNFAVTSGASAIANLELWLDATRNDTLTIATGVSAWADASGNGRTFVQATAGQQPSKIAAVQNGLQIVRFDGVNDVMTYQSTNIELSAGSTLFIVTSPRFVNDTAGRSLFRITSTAIGVQHEPTNDPNVASRSKLETYAITNAGLLRAIPAGVTANGWRVITSRVAPAEPTITMYKNGIVDGGPTAGFATVVSSLGDLFLLCFDNGVSYGTYDIGEVLLFSRALTSVERTLVEAILLAKWGLP